MFNPLKLLTVTTLTIILSFDLALAAPLSRRQYSFTCKYIVSLGGLCDQTEGTVRVYLYISSLADQRMPDSNFDDHYDVPPKPDYDPMPHYSLSNDQPSGLDADMFCSDLEISELHGSAPDPHGFVSSSLLTPSLLNPEPVQSKDWSSGDKHALISTFEPLEPFRYDEDFAPQWLDDLCVCDQACEEGSCDCNEEDFFVWSCIHRESHDSCTWMPDT
jgi:hypothetical protein